MSLSREDLMSPGPAFRSAGNSDAIRAAAATAASAAAAAAYHTHTAHNNAAATQPRRHQFSPSSGFSVSPGRTEISPRHRTEINETAEVTIRADHESDFAVGSRVSRVGGAAVATNELIMKSRETIVRLQQELDGERSKVRQLSSDLSLAKRELSDEKLSASSSSHGATMALDKETRLLRELGLLKANERVLKAKVDELERELDRLERTEQKSLHLEETLRIREEELLNERELIRSLQETIRSKDELLKETTITLCNLDEKLNSQDLIKSSNQENQQKELIQLKIENGRLKSELKEFGHQFQLKSNELQAEMKSTIEIKLNKMEMQMEHLKDQENQLARMLNSTVKLQADNKSRLAADQQAIIKERAALEQQKAAMNEASRSEHAKQLEKMQRMFEEKMTKFESTAAAATTANQLDYNQRNANFQQAVNMQAAEQEIYQSPRQQQQQSQPQQQRIGSPMSPIYSQPQQMQMQNQPQQPQQQHHQTAYQNQNQNQIPQQQQQQQLSSQSHYDDRASPISPVIIRTGEGQTEIQAAGQTNINIKLVPANNKTESMETDNETAEESLKLIQSRYEEQLTSLHQRLLELRASDGAVESDKAARIVELEAKVKKLKIRFAHDQRSIGALQQEIKTIKKKLSSQMENSEKLEGRKEELTQLGVELSATRRDLQGLEEKLKMEIKLRKMAESEMKRFASIAEVTEVNNGILSNEKEKLLGLLKGALDAGHKGESLHSGLMKKLEKVIQTVEHELDRKENKKSTKEIKSI